MQIPNKITKNNITYNHIGQAQTKEGNVLYVFKGLDDKEYRLTKKGVLKELKTADKVEYLPNVNI